MIQIFKSLYILHHTDHILDISKCVEDRYSGDHTQSGHSIHIVEITVGLKPLYQLLFFHDKIKDADIHDLQKIMDIVAEKFRAGNISPVDQVCIDKQVISLWIEQGDPDINVIEYFSKRK